MRRVSAASFFSGYEKMFPNVRTPDRVVRFIFGIAMIAGGWLLGLPMWQSAVMSVAGLMSLSTAVLAKCSVYYLLGYSTCAVSGESLRARNL